MHPVMFIRSTMRPWRAPLATFVRTLKLGGKGDASLCATNARRGVSSARCFIEDEGGPLEAGVQTQASNHLKPRWSRAIVVSVEAKGGARLRQVRLKKTNASEPLMTCRNPLHGVETGMRVEPGMEAGRKLLTAQPASGMKAA